MRIEGISETTDADLVTKVVAGPPVDSGPRNRLLVLQG